MESAGQNYKYHIITYGCQMNKSDSERFSSVFEKMGFSEAQEPKDADVVLLNSCSVRQTAEDRVYGKVAELSKIRNQFKNDMVIAVTGCMAGRDKSGEIRKRIPQADLFFSTREMVNLPRWLSEIRPQFANNLDLGQDYLNIFPSRRADHRAFISIQTGCNWFCTYCVVPYARGLESYRPLKSILDEANESARHGVLEITLLGQTVNHYKASDPENFSPQNPYSNHFAKLLWEMNQMSGADRIHFTSAHPMHMDDEIIHALGLSKHVNYLHLPIQSGDNEVLKKMNRKYTVQEYFERLDKIKEKYPRIALATDIIVGFCGETEAQFMNTVEAYKRARYDISYTAMYSPRTGTLGCKLFRDDVPREEKKRRWRFLQDIMERIALEKNQEYVGGTVEVLVDSCNNGICKGNSRELKLVSFKGAPDLDLVGSVQKVKVMKAMEWMLEGEISKPLK